MASSDEKPGFTPLAGHAGSDPPGQQATLGSKLLDAGAQLLQSLKPVRQMNLHVCTFALYAHDLSRQIEAHLFVKRVNQDFLQCAVYDSDKPSARLIGVEYIVSDEVFETLPKEEQKLWHSHAYEIKAGLWTEPGVPEALQDPSHKSFTKTYGKFWCTWQVDRGDRVPLGAPALMMSPQVSDMSDVTCVDAGLVEDGRGIMGTRLGMRRKEGWRWRNRSGLILTRIIGSNMAKDSQLML
ncbi:hypothetical protein LUZ60_000501 [Juncus effusus]|nr:hypothetical protein LUZ60_000501 [Juncus effusus]